MGIINVKDNNSSLCDVKEMYIIGVGVISNWRNFMKKVKIQKSISIINIQIIIFIFVLLITVSSLGYLVFSGWTTSSKRSINYIANDMNENIYNKIGYLLNVPKDINEVNHKIIENEILDLSNAVIRDKFFVGVLKSYSKEIYSFSFGTAKGEYYGARRNEDGNIEIMRNNAETGGNSWYYSLKDTFSPGRLVLKAGAFDPRTRDWYKVAAQSNGPSFSPVYKHFVMNDLTVSASYPVYRKGKLFGVLGTHMLLTNIGTYLKENVQDNNGYAFIVEKNTGKLIANSTGSKNFSVRTDGTIVRKTLNDLNNPDIFHAYNQYKKEKNSSFLYASSKGNLFFSMKEFKQKGIEWVIITTVPESLLISEVNQNKSLAIFFSVIALILSIVIYYFINKKLFKPMLDLLKVSDNIASGNFSDRAIIARNDEIGRISIAFNKMTDYLQYLIINLEETVKKRTLELEDNKNQLQLILDSTAEAICGIDTEGICTFCNISCYQILGYDKQEDLLGKNMHNMLLKYDINGNYTTIIEKSILEVMENDKGVHVTDAVFWKNDGNSFDVEYYAYPQKKDGKVIGVVITFTDISERRKAEKEIMYLSSHDVLTGLNNRAFFEENLKKLDVLSNLPLAIIFADINNLKMTNDIFGHMAGDTLIKKAADILRESCRKNDLISRTGGDEFIIAMSNANEEDTERVLSRIRSSFINTQVAAIKCSVALGSSIKISSDQSIEEVIVNAENIMYKDKVLSRSSTNSKILDSLIETFHYKYNREKQHAHNVSKLSEKLGIALSVTDAELSKVKQAGFLHDIGKIAIEEGLLSDKFLDEEKQEKLHQHVIIGYRILSLFDDTIDISEIVYSHHERWDGRGYPRGLKEEEIPLLSRVIAVTDSYERIISRDEKQIENAIQIIRASAGSQFDPRIVDVFINMMESDGNNANKALE